MGSMIWKLAAALVVAVAGVSQGACAAGPVQGAPIAKAKSVFIVRHFQKADGADPSLTAEGAANAVHLAEMLKDKGVTAVFATPTKRAMQSAMPLTAALGLNVTPYDPRDPQALAAAVRASARSVLIVGHSNTVPDLVAMFGGAKPPALSDTDYGTLYDVEPDGSVRTSAVR